MVFHQLDARAFHYQLAMTLGKAAESHPGRPAQRCPLRPDRVWDLSEVVVLIDENPRPLQNLLFFVAAVCDRRGFPVNPHFFGAHRTPPQLFCRGLNSK